MSTPPDQTVTPCPVSWCPEAGHHEWDGTPGDEAFRFHQVRSRITAEGAGRDMAVTVSAVVFEETDEPIDRSVQIVTDEAEDAIAFLRSRAAVAELVAALQRAADLVFPESMD